MPWIPVGDLQLPKKETLFGALSSGMALLIWSRGRSSSVYRLDLATHQRLWRVEYTESYLLRAPSPYLILQNRVPGLKESSIQRRMQALRPEDGAVMWERANSAVFYTIGPKAVLLIEKRRKETLLSALAPDSGALLRRRLLPFSLSYIASTGEGFLGYEPGGRELVFDKEGDLVCELPASRAPYISHIVTDGSGGVYFETERETPLLNYWDASRGQEIAAWPLSPRPQIIRPLPQPGRVLLLLVGSREASLGVFDAERGEFLWKRDPGPVQHPELCLTPHGVFLTEYSQPPRCFSAETGEDLPALPDPKGVVNQRVIWTGRYLVHYASQAVYEHRDP